MTVWIDPYTTRNYKIYVEGARVDEVPMPGEKPSLAQFGFQVRDGNLRRPRRKMYRRLPFGSVPGYAPICFDSSDPLTVKKGCEQRVLRIAPTPNGALLQEFRMYCRRKFRKWFGNIGQAEKMTFQDWLESLLDVNQLRKFQFEQADKDNRGGPPPVSVARKIVCFIKSEFYATFKFPRWIMSRKDRFKVFFGPIVKAMEKLVYTRPEFVKHMSMEQRAARTSQIDKAGGTPYVSDFSSFESSFIHPVMAATDFELLDALAPWWVWNSYAQHVLGGMNELTIRSLFVILILEARRMSGEMSTSLFNGVANLMITKFLVWKKKGKLDILVEGDDSVFRSTVTLTPADYATLGFEAKLVEVESACLPIPVDKTVEPGSVAFCGISFSKDGQAMKEPRKFLQGFGWTHSFIHGGDEIMKQLLKAKSLSACYEAPNCPIVGKLARVALSTVERVNLTERMAREVYNVHAAPGYGFERLMCPASLAPHFAPSLETRESFAALFGIAVEQQLCIEEAIERKDMVQVSALLPPTFEQTWFATRYVVAG